MLFTIILAGLDNTIVSTVIPVALPELGGAHMYAWTKPNRLQIVPRYGLEASSRRKRVGEATGDGIEARQISSTP